MASRTDSDGNRLSKVNRVTKEDAAYRNQKLDNDSKLLSASIAQNSLLTEIFEFFVGHDDGYLKVRRALDSSDLHLTWSWSSGEHAGTYVYVRVEYWRVIFGLDLLRIKVLEAEQGLRPPTPDKMRSGNS